MAHFQKRIDILVGDCAFKDGPSDLIKSASKIFYFLVYSGALVTTFHSNWWLGKWI